MTAYNVSLGEATWRRGPGKSRAFRPSGRITQEYVSPKRLVLDEAKRTRWGAGGLAARLFVGLKVGDEIKWTVDDVVAIVKEVREKQNALPNASILSQKGIYLSKDGKTVIEEPSVQIVIIDEVGTPKAQFQEEMLQLGEELLERLEQESVVVELQRRGVVTDVWGLEP